MVLNLIFGNQLHRLDSLYKHSLNLFEHELLSCTFMSIFKHKLSPYSPKNYLRHVLYPYSVHFSKYDEKFSLKILNRRRRLSFISRSKGNQPFLRLRSNANPPPTKTTKTTITNSATFGSHKSNSQFLSDFATL